MNSRIYTSGVFIGALQDFRYGARILWKSPGLSATAVVLIALVIGLNTTVYSMVHALITRPAPGVRAQNMVVLDTPGDFEPFFAYPEYLEFQAETKTLRSLVGYGAEPMTFASSEGSYGLFGSYVTSNYFEGLDVEIVRGRGFTPADDLPGAPAIAFAYWVSTNIPRLIVPPGSMNGLGMRPNHMNMDFSPDLRVLSYALLLALLGTVFFCVAPALRMWKQELLPGLKTGEQSVVRGRSRVSNALVVVQLAFSVVLLTSAGLAYRSLSLITSLDLGFNTDNLLLVTVNPTLSITNREANLAYLEHIRERFVTVPSVQSVSYVRLPPPYSLFRGRVGALNQQRPIVANINYVGPDFLRVLGMAPVLGREFSATEGASSRKVAIINQNLALALWPNQSPIGQTVPIQGGKDAPVIIGITPNALFSDRDEPHFLFLAEQQDRERLTGQAGLFQSGETTFYVRYAGNLDAVAPAIRGAMRAVDERVPVINMRTMQTQLDRGHEGARTLAAFLSLFSAGSLMIAAMGQYAVVAFEMRRRTREFGIRVAMGASARQIHSSILKEGLILTGIGLLIGFGLSITAGLAFRVSLAGVTPTDGRTYFGVFVLLAAASLLACYLPARRAARVDPLVALRYE